MNGRGLTQRPFFSEFVLKTYNSLLTCQIKKDTIIQNIVYSMNMGYYNLF